MIHLKNILSNSNEYIHLKLKYKCLIIAILLTAIAFTGFSIIKYLSTQNINLDDTPDFLQAIKFIALMAVCFTGYYLIFCILAGSILSIIGKISFQELKALILQSKYPTDWFIEKYKQVSQNKRIEESKNAENRSYLISYTLLAVFLLIISYTVTKVITVL